MGWIKRAAIQQAHKCEPPMVEDPRHSPDSLDYDQLIPGGGEGSIWRCDDCAKLWQVNRWVVNGGDEYLEWNKASLINRRYYKHENGDKP